MLLSSMLVALANETTFLGPENAQPFLIVSFLKTCLTTFYQHLQYCNMTEDKEDRK